MSFRENVLIGKARTRKNGSMHWCRWCNEDIMPGAQYVTVTGRDGGDFYSAKFHPECFRAEHFWWADDHSQDSWPTDIMARGMSSDSKTHGTAYSRDPLTKEEVEHPHQHSHKWRVNP